MFPAWVSKLRDVKRTETKQAQSKTPSLSPSPSRKRQDKSPPRFAKAVSLQRANSRARKSQAEVRHDSSSGDHHKAVSGDLARRFTTHSDGYGGVVATSHGNEGHHNAVICIPHELRSELSNMSKDGIINVDLQNKRPPAGCRAHDMYDIDTEESTLTPNTIESSFSSETSSLDSVSGCSEAKEQESPWQDDGVSFGLKRLSFARSKKGDRSIHSLRYVDNGTWCEDTTLAKTANNQSSMMSCECREDCLSPSEHGRIFRTPEECPSVRPAGEGKQRGLINNQNQRDNAATEKDSTERECSFGIRTCCSHDSLHGNWDDESASIAAEYPDLMLSCKWQETCGLRSTNTRSLQDVIDKEENAPNSIENSNLSPCAEWPDQSIEGRHTAKCAAYSLRRERRERGSSLSAVLPEELQRVAGESVALVKISENPYEDFRQSMYEMILERDLEELMDVEELLSCYLTLNPPELHDLIQEVFSDVWSAVLMIVR